MAERKLVIRRAEPSDEAIVRTFLEGLSADTRWKRYHNAVPQVRPWMIDPVVRPDRVHHDALLAVQAGRVIGIAEWGRFDAGGEADMAIVVSEDCRRHGIARAMLRRLARSARSQGIETFSGSILSVNRASVALLRNVAPTYSTSFDGGTIEFRVPLQASA